MLVLRLVVAPRSGRWADIDVDITVACYTITVAL